MWLCMFMELGGVVLKASPVLVASDQRVEPLAEASTSARVTCLCLADMQRGVAAPARKPRKEARKSATAGGVGAASPKDQEEVAERKARKPVEKKLKELPASQKQKQRQKQALDGVVVKGGVVDFMGAGEQSAPAVGSKKKRKEKKNSGKDSVERPPDRRQAKAAAKKGGGQGKKPVGKLRVAAGGVSKS
jgi:hypothetical protein